ncbi:AsmA family protein [Stappia sp.]|uniref:AsmA family protein n=1 Tax=Stappia sp. TaxID=1870903 RepID=UPI003A98D8AC
MKRLAIGVVGGLVALLALAMVVPLLLPKDAIRAELIAQIEARTGWHLRLDGAVGLSLLPGLRMTASDVGVAGPDGMEFLRVGEVDFGLAWGTLFGGSAKLTHIALDRPQVQVGGDAGTEAVKAAEGFPLDRWSAATEAISESNSEAARSERPGAVETADEGRAAEAAGGAAMLARIGVDRLTVTNGTLVIGSAEGGQRIEKIDMQVSLPSLAGPMDLSGSFVHRGVEIEVAGDIAAPLALAEGEASGVELTLTGAGVTAGVTGDASMSGESNLRVSAEGAALGETLAVFGVATGPEPGSFGMTAQLRLTRNAVDVAGLTARLGEAQLRGDGRADLSSGEPAVEARLALADASLSNLLALAGRSEEARGTLAGDVRLSASGSDMARLMGTLDIAGKLSLAGGGISGLALPAPLGDDPAASKIENLALAVSFSGLDAPVTLNGGLTWRGEAFRVDGSATPALMMAGMPAPTSLRISGSRVTLGYEGAFSPASGLDGDVVVETADLRGLAGWLGMPLSGDGGLKRFAFSGKLDTSETAVSFRQAHIRLDETTGTGEGTLTLSSPPKLTGTLALDRLAVDPYMQAARSGGIESAPRVPGAEGSGWSRAPIDLSGLKAFAADLDLTAKAISWDGVEVGPSRLKVVLSGGKLEATLAEMALYGGSGKGRLMLDGGGAVPELAASFDLAGVGGRSLLAALAGFDWIDGELTVGTDLVARGTSTFELVSSLAGTARFDFANGSIRGINIPRMVRGLTVDTLLGWASNPEQKTDFSALGAGFEIARGIATSDDLALVGPLVRMTGSGRIDMPEKLLDWRLEPRVVATLEGAPPVPLGKGESHALEGLGVPVIVRGPWARPQIYPDIQGILENPQAALKQLDGFGGGLVKALSSARESGKGGGSVGDALTNAANDAIGRATGGSTHIDVQKVIDGEVDDQEVLDAVEQGFGLPQGFLGSLGGRKKQPRDSGGTATPAQPSP